MRKGRTYCQITKEERKQIEVLLKAGKGKKEIGALMGRHPSTIGRELKRNTAQRGVTAKQYIAENAHRRCTLRHKEKPKQVIFDQAMKNQINKWLTVEKWSPEIISFKGEKLFGEFVSAEWIYQWIWQCKHSNRKEDHPYKCMYKYLKHGRRRRKRGNIRDCRGQIPNRVMIDSRPEVINKRKRKGDYEADLILGKDRKPGLLILTDRKTRMTKLKKLKSKKATEVKRKIKQISKSVPVKSITFDNDLAFAQHDKLCDELEIKTFFTHPYTSQEKGTVENRIGVLRRFFPKQTDFDQVDEKQVKEVEKMLNNRPMRMFNYRSPKEMADSLYLHLWAPLKIIFKIT